MTCRSSVVPLVAALFIAGCASRNATLGTWQGMSADPNPGSKAEFYKLAITDKNATLYDKTGTATGSYPVTFPNANEAVIAGFFGVPVDVTAQPDGSVRVVGLNRSSTLSGQSTSSSDIFRAAP